MTFYSLRPHLAGIAIGTLILAACSSSSSVSAPVDNRPAPQLVTTGYSGPLVPATFARNETTVSVSGIVTVPQSCQTVSATDAMSGSVLTISLAASAPAGSCAQVVTSYRYSVTSFTGQNAVTEVRVVETNVPGAPVLLADVTIGATVAG